MTCTVCNTPLNGLKKKFCSVKCKSKKHQNNSYSAQQNRGRLRKIEFVAQKGGKCEKCGYNKNYSALSFHHRDPSTKKFSLDLRILSNTNLDELKLELDKCDLLCLNCHMELHNPTHDII